MNLRGYALVTIAYWALTITDGAMRMLVLLHFHELGYGPVTLGFLFVGYEACGIATNLLGGRLGGRYGLERTLHLGLWLQVAALVALSMTEPTWTEAVSIAWVMGCQGLSGVAKDLTKMSSKSAVKLIVKEKHDGSHRSVLLRLVALLTGSKNALKGAGFFVGGALLAWIGFGPALLALAGMLAAASIATLLGLRTSLPPAKTAARTATSWSRSPAVNRLSVARVFLFGARDLWFVVGLPIFLAEDAEWSVEGIGAFMAIWVIGYGLVQAGAPWVQSKLVLGDRNTDESALARRWMLVLIFITVGIAGVLLLGSASAAVPVVVIGLLIFGVAFAVESALHSYLILAFASKTDVAQDVGFYYAANATGRLFGTLLSGVCFLMGGLSTCLLVSAGFLLISTLVAWRLPETRPPAIDSSGARSPAGSSIR
ncbi:MAG: organoarsenical effux MFS transporter ArsJ [Phycisphaeraceae bacterium]|nr:organoarsenical effux MFS transporter ArsJ [Phycisphaeraceae bacterium]